MTLDRAPEDILREEQENEGPVGYIGNTAEEAERPPGLGLPQYDAEQFGIHGVLNYSYWNANGIAMVILAVEGGAADWAAYIGGQPSMGLSEEDTVRWTARKGCKLSREQAHRWFPQLPIERYRE